MTFSVAQWIFVTCIWMLIGVIQGRGSNPIRYRAVRYGNYYSSVYYSYSGGKGYARYSRVYSHAANHYPSLYSYMFKWLNTEQYKVYKNTPSGYIAVCKNYEANENGTYLGIFTCPLPYVPADLAYCCGLTNAQYCCRFWDVPLNVAAACIAMAMGMLILVTSVYITIQLCISRRKNSKETNRRKAILRIGKLRRLGRRMTSGSKWALGLFDRVHAPGNMSENSSTIEQDEFDEIGNSNVQENGITVTKRLPAEHECHSNNDVTNASDVDENTVAEDTARKFTHDIGNGTASLTETGKKSERTGGGHESFINKAFLASWRENRNQVKDFPTEEHALKPLRNSPRIKFNSDSNEGKFMTRKDQ